MSRAPVASRSNAAGARTVARRAALPSWSGWGRLVRSALLGLGTALGAAGCGRASDARPAPVLQPSSDGTYVGQELWLTYTSPAHAGIGRRIERPREVARQIARSLRDKVSAGASLGALAWEHSNAPGGCAEGFSGRLPRQPEAPDERDLALMRAREGELTELVDWQGGWWFARRVSAQEGRRLAELFEERRLTRVRLRLLHVHHRDAFPRRFNLTRTSDEARQLAEAYLARAQSGESLERLAALYSEDSSGDNAGVARSTHAGRPVASEWLRVDDPGFPWQLLQIAFEAPVGALWPNVVQHGRGFDLVEVLDRRRLTAEEARDPTR